MLTKLVCYWFARSRLRRGPKIDPKLKNLASHHAFQKQIKEYRREFETSDLTETFSQVINTKKPILKKRFKIDQVKLSKHIKKVINKMISVEKLIPASDEQDDLKFLNESKSFIHDQSLQVNFQEKFKKELFMKKQTQRMLGKQDLNFKNFLPQNKNNKYNSYVNAKTKLKNNRISSMMNYKRNNEELQLLIESGFIDDPDNIKLIINKINQNDIKQIQGKEKEENSISLVHHEEAEGGTEGDNLQNEMMKHIQGPEETRDYSKIQQFLERYRAHSESQKIKASEDLNLILKIKQYQRNLFLSRYDMINFRFKGRVKFDFFKQHELLSYIKNQTIEPTDLFQIYQTNKNEINKFKVPIITPAVMSRIYTKTSTYRFSEDDQNNHINMLNDPIFQSLQSSLFRELDKISDQLYCDTVYSYAKNHQLERGVLNIKKSDAIQKAIFEEALERVHRLREVDLGLLFRSMIKLPLMKNSNYNDRWEQIVHVLDHRLPEMKLDYQWESSMQFLTLLPSSEATLSLIAKNINFFKKYQWQAKQTLLSFARVGTALINHSNLLDPFDINKTLIVLKEIAAEKTQEIKVILPSLTINELASILVIFEELNKIPMKPDVPEIILNLAKKQIVNGIRTQKHKIYQQTISTLVSTLSSYDYYQNIIKSDSKYIDSDLYVRPYQNVSILKYVPLKNMLPGRVFTFNSQLYFVYHEFAKLLQVEEEMLGVKPLCDSIFGLGLVQYKNEGAFDTLCYRVVEKIEKNQKERKQQTLTSSEVANLMKVINAYSLQKRSTDLVDQICDQILINGKSSMSEIHLNLLIRFFGSYFNIFTQPTELPESKNQEYQYLQQKWKRNSNLTFSFLYCFKNYIVPFFTNLEVEELITLYFIQTMILNNFNRIKLTNEGLHEKYEKLSKESIQNLKIILKELEKKDDNKISSDYKYVINLCLQLNKEDVQIKTQLSLGSFEDLQRKFYNRHIEGILKHEENVGVVSSYNQIYKKISKKLLEKSKNPQNISEKLWRIEDQENQIVFIFATFEHLMTKQSQDETAFGLFGFWKIYPQIYRRKGWKIQLVCTMLEQ